MIGKWIRVLFCVLAFGSRPAAESPAVKVGDPAPKLRLETLIGAPPGASATWAAFRGNVVVVEFWATWCSPCREAIPHLNELAVRFKGKPVRFLSISDEKEWKVRNFLSVHPIDGWIGLDPTNGFYKSFGFETIPQTVVIDRNGKVAALLQPSGLTEDLLNRVQAGEPISAPFASTASATPVPASPAADVGRPVPSLFEILLRPAPPSSSMSVRRGSFTAKGMSLKNLASYAYGIPATRIIAEGIPFDGSYEVSIRVPAEKGGRVIPLLRQALEEALGLANKLETRVLDVLILRAPAGEQRRLRPPTGSNAGWMTDEGQISGSALSIRDFCASLESGLRRIVIDETGISGTYEIGFFWDPRDDSSAFREIGKQLGLELIKTRRPVEVLLLRQRSLGS